MIAASRILRRVGLCTLPLCSADIGESGARARLAFRISNEDILRSVATSCRNGARME